MSKTDPLRYVLLLFLLIGIGFLSAAIYAFVTHKKFMDSATKTSGRVINLQSNRKGSKAPIVEYSDANGKAHFYYHNVYSKPSAYDLGETVEVYFNPANPDDATLGGISALTVIFGFLGFVFTLVSVVCIKVFWNQSAVLPQKHY
ncbi:DUF3592 domain-containing protein [Emticicia fontis]